MDMDFGLPLPVIIATAFVFGAVIGSFLNVVILRLPSMLEARWKRDCSELLELEQPKSDDPPGLVKPASHCPKCKAPIKPWHNIPIISYLLLRGRCNNCGESISIRYPAVELLTATLTALAIFSFGLTPQGIAAVLLIWILIALAFIDLDTQLLPDAITIPALWVGLLLNTQSLFAEPIDAIIGAATGYLFLWSIYQLFRLLTGKEGMGYGDFKLLAVFGAWFGWQLLPQILVISSLAGAVIGILMIVTGLNKKGQPIPFGPYLAIAGAIALIWGEPINSWYLAISGIA